MPNPGCDMIAGGCAAVAYVVVACIAILPDAG